MLKNLDRWKTFLGPDQETGTSGQGQGNHYQDFIEAIRSGDNLKARGNIREGFYSCVLVHLANISYRLGRSLEFDPASLRFKGDEQANALLNRVYRKPFVVPEKV
jgi:hypothetical protein